MYPFSKFPGHAAVFMEVLKIVYMLNDGAISFEIILKSLGASHHDPVSQTHSAFPLCFVHK